MTNVIIIHVFGIMTIIKFTIIMRPHPNYLVQGGSWNICQQEVDFFVAMVK
jgi:hypothetical protein